MVYHYLVQCSNRFGKKLNDLFLSINLPNKEKSDQTDQSFKETKCLEIPLFSQTFPLKLLSQSDPNECQQSNGFWSGSQEEEEKNESGIVFNQPYAIFCT